MMYKLPIADLLSSQSSQSSVSSVLVTVSANSPAPAARQRET